MLPHRRSPCRLHARLQASSGLPENTLASFKRAIQEGAEGIETGRYLLATCLLLRQMGRACWRRPASTDPVLGRGPRSLLTRAHLRRRRRRRRRAQIHYR